jgi:myo-inositol-1-phosphate synthase
VPRRPDQLLPAAGDNKEGWDNIDIFGWLGYPMQLKINFLCRDSILAAPIVLDVALFLDLAKRRAYMAFRSGCRSTSRRRCTRRAVS